MPPRPRPPKTPPTPRAEQKCDNCFAFLRHPDDATRGWCRVFPPTVIMTAPVGGEAHGNPQSYWPEVNAVDWCARWRHIGSE